MSVVRAEKTKKTSLTVKRNPVVVVGEQGGTWICEIRRCRMDDILMWLYSPILEWQSLSQGLQTKAKLWICWPTLSLSFLLCLFSSPSTLILVSNSDSPSFTKLLHASLSSASFPVCNIDVAFAWVSLTNILVTLQRTSYGPISLSKFAVQQILRHPAISHPSEMPQPAEPALFQETVEADNACSLKYLFVTLSCHFIPRMSLRCRMWKLFKRFSWVACDVELLVFPYDSWRV